MADTGQRLNDVHILDLGIPLPVVYGAECGWTREWVSYVCCERVRGCVCVHVSDVSHNEVINMNIIVENVNVHKSITIYYYYKCIT